MKHLVLATVVLIGLTAAGAVCGLAQDEDLFPIRRVLADQGFLLREVARQRELTPVPLGLFDETLRRAREAQGNLRPRARILKARYQAAFTPAGLVGTAELEVHNPSTLPTVAILDPWNLAASAEATLDGWPARLGESGSGVGLVLEGAGTRTLRLDWSLRTELRPEGTWCFFQVPDCPVSVLDVEAPPGQMLELPGTRQTPVLSLGSDGGKQAWRIPTGGRRGGLELLLRRESDPGKPPLILAQVETDHLLGGQGLDASHRFDIEFVHERARRLEVLCDPGFQPADAVLNAHSKMPLSWTSRSTAEGKVLAVELPETGGFMARLELRGRYPHAADQKEPVSFPTVRLRHAWTEKDVMRIRLPEGSWAGWEFGDYEPDDPAAEGGAPAETITLAWSGGTAQGLPRPPAARVERSNRAVVQQDSWWLLGQGRNHLTVRTVWQGSGQGVGEVAYRLPDGWRVEDVDVLPSDLPTTWEWSAADSILRAQVLGPPASRSTVRVTLRLTAPAPAPGASADLPVPSVIPLDVGRFEGTLAIGLERAADGTCPFGIRAVSIRARPAQGINHRLTSLWGSPPEAAFTFHDPRVSGRIQLSVSTAKPPATGDAAPSREPRRSLPVSDTPGLKVVSSYTHETAYPSGTRLIAYSCRLVHSPGSKATVVLPAGAVLQNASVNGRRLDEGASASGEVVLPLEGVETNCRLGYSIPGLPQFWWRRLFRVEPRWPDAAAVLPGEYAWQLPEQEVPLSASVAARAAAPAGWNTWDSTGPAESILVVPGHFLHQAGLALAVLCLAATVGLGRWPRIRTVFLALTVAGTLLALIWLPRGTAIAGWPLAATLLAAMVGGKAIYSLAGWVARPRAVTATSSALVLGLLAWGATARTQPPGPTTVYLLPGPPGETARVLVPRAFWKSLGEAARTPPGGAEAPVLLAARYRGKIENGLAVINVQFRYEVLDDSPRRIVVPLRGVRLSRVLLDSAPVLATPAADEGGGLVVLVPGKGEHVIELTWETPLTAQGSLALLRHDVPPCVHSHLHLELPAGMEWAQADARGRQTLRRQAAGAPATLDADLGRVSELLVRLGPREAAAESAETEEAYLYTFRPGRSEVSFACRVRAKGATQLRMRLPPGLAVAGIETGGPEPAPRIRDWAVAGPPDERRLLVRLAFPASGVFWLRGSLFMEAVTSEPQIALDPPALVDRARRSVLLAVRHESLRILSIRPGMGWQPAATEEFQRFWPDVLGSGLPLDACFRLDPAQIKTAGAIQTGPNVPSATALVRVWLDAGPAEVEVRGKIELSIREGGMNFLELEAPRRLMVHTVSGRDVDRWTEEAGRIQVWFKRRITDAADLMLGGWMATDPAGAEAESFELPWLKIMGGTKAATQIEIAAAAGWRIGLEKLKGIQAAANPPVENGPAVCLLAQGPYQGTILLTPVLPVPAGGAGPNGQEEKRKAEEANEPASPAVRIFWVAGDSRLTQEGIVVHTVRLAALHDGGGMIETRIPPGGNLLHARIDDRLAPLGRKDGKILLELPAGPGWRLAEWQWTEAATDLLQPPGMPEAIGPAAWTLHVPPGRRVEGPAPGADPGDLALAIAAAQVQLVAALAESRGDSAEARAAMTRGLEAATAMLAAIENQGREPAATKVLALRRTLERQLQNTRWDRLRKRVAAEPPRPGGWTYPATPAAGYFLLGTAHSPAGGIGVRAAEPEQRDRAWAATILVGLLLAGLTLVSFTERGANWQRRLRPELLLVAGLVCWLATPAVFLGGVLLAAWGLWRLAALLTPRSFPAAAA